MLTRTQRFCRSATAVLSEKLIVPGSQGLVKLHPGMDPVLGEFFGLERMMDSWALKGLLSVERNLGLDVKVTNPENVSGVMRKGRKLQKVGGVVVMKCLASGGCAG